MPLKELNGQYQPDLPLVGSGPYVVTDYQRGRIITMERNPNWRGEPGAYDEIQFIKYGNQDAVERALQLGEIDLVREVEASSFARLGTQEDVATQPQQHARLHPALLQLSARSSSAPTPTSTRRSRTGPCARRSPTGSTATR